MLPKHEARCHGIGCVVRGTCLRFIHRTDTGPRTPFYSRQPESVGNCPLLKTSPDQRVITTNKTGA